MDAAEEVEEGSPVELGPGEVDVYHEVILVKVYVEYHVSVGAY